MPRWTVAGSSFISDWRNWADWISCLPFTKAKTIAKKCPPKASGILSIGPWKKDKGGGSVWAFRRV
jgi:hypothetical protein